MKRSTTPRGVFAAATLMATLVACTATDKTAAGDSAAAAKGAGDSALAASAQALAPDSGRAALGGFIDPNTATREQLMALPGMDSTTATALVSGRPYNDMLAVDKVLTAGKLSEAQRDTIYTRMWRPIDLNKASAAEIELIPGVGPKMRGEFEEYRDYTDMAQFRREIGKYVNSTEVARLERYVTIR
jgi:DNA uptake protein ComE-like DNA-binding protein